MEKHAERREAELLERAGGVREGGDGAAAAGTLRSIGGVVALLGDEFEGVTPSSLRFFEREGLVVPRRTPGGHRLYGNAEIDRLRRIKRWQRDERLSLAAIRARLAAADQLPQAPALARAFLQEALDGRAEAARAIVTDAHVAGQPLGRVFRDVLQPVLRAVGDRWAAGTLSIAQEHEVSALVRDVVAELAARATRTGAPGATIVAACAPGERHDLGLRMTAAELQERGYAVHFLGADVPATALLDAIRTRRPAVALLSITREEHAPALEEALRALAALPAAERPRILVGGQAAAPLATRLAALGAETVPPDEAPIRWIERDAR